MQGAYPRLIVGLGNPGPEYHDTRHNIGFMIIDQMIRQAGSRISPSRHAHTSFIWSFPVKGQQAFLQKPLTYMNLSGKAVAGLLRETEMTPADLLVVYDDADLPLGRMRARGKGSSGGHNGIESIIQEIGSAAFARLRIGVGQDEENTMDRADFVLAPFKEAELPIVARVCEKAVEAIKLAMHRGITPVMNEFNGLLIGEEPPNTNNERGEPDV